MTHLILRDATTACSSRHLMRPSKQNGWMERFAIIRTAKAKWVLWSALLVLILLVAVLTSGFWYTPTTSGTVVNDTSSTWSVANCADYLVTLAPGQSQLVEPFVRASSGCTVYRGRNDQGKPFGCLIFPRNNGGVIGGSRVRLSTMTSYSNQLCSD
jgi:hypothetical protein